MHQSQQLSYFMVGLLELLKEKGFGHLALELGPNSAEILQNISITPGDVESEIKRLNNDYGKKSGFKIPIIFADKIEDALFIGKASGLGYSFWGLDQEFAYSYEMHLDNIFKSVNSPSSELEQLYLECKELVRKSIFKNKISGITNNCWYQQNETIENFFEKFKDNLKAQKIIQDLKITWDIYCKSETGQGSNQQRADYMKHNFDSLYSLASQKETSPKVLVKLGGVHLTHGLSPFRVDDMGKHLHEKSASKGTGFLSIRHLITYRNGKSNIGRSGWKGVGMFLELGRKDQWTLVDLRLFRDKVLSGELTTNEKYLHELTSYDLLLIPPKDKIGTLNY